ncbi:ester cyclase [Sphingomonas colocasiae]|uniref:Ester cyclase n=1 Tax=Sphingomonas colocasiae TaxID=1848973 RepID=A0ABS7PY55_9SPHN|nr:ester cyclase [Sphingomonas colocasiae]MBY8826287.1 ester cyclase [Sphingomonas colocasiae]
MSKPGEAKSESADVTALRIPATPDPRETVSRVRQRPVNDLLSPRSVRTQSLDGFEDVYSDIVHYIAYCTHRIWAEKGVGLIYSHYDDAVVVHTPYGTQTSVEEVVAGTIQMMQAFPDRESRLGNVAWTGDDKQGFYTSHLGTSRMTNLGPSIYGPATGKKVRIRHIADCMIRRNLIYREWLVRDNGALVRQLGLDPVEVATKLAAAAARSGVPPIVSGLPERGSGQKHPEPLDLPSGPQASMEDNLRHMFHDVWNRRRFDRIKDYFAADVNVQTAPGREVHGVQGIMWTVISMLAAFPDAVMHFDHFCDTHETDGYIAAVRWSLNGTHLGNGQFGPPSGKPVSILGMSHFRFKNGKIAQEWTVWDEIAVLMQIHSPHNSLMVAAD